MIFLLCLAFNCDLRSVVIQLALLSSLLLLTSSIRIGHLTDLHPWNHSTDPVYHHSIDLSSLNHSIDSLDMPVITRSKAKGLSYNIPIAASSGRSDSSTTCDTSHKFVVNKGKDSSSVSSIIVHDFETCTCSSFQTFEISNFQNNALVAESTQSTLSHNLKNQCSLDMASDCEESLFTQNTSTMSDNQDDIVKMLTVISQQMMTNYQDIQQQLAQTDLRLSSDIAQIIQDNENFKNEIRQELLLMGPQGLLL
jgi:hypothetical protein